MKAKLLVLVALLTPFLGDAAQACNVPVFRYALEHWHADPYRIVVFHRGPLSADELKLIRPLEAEQDQRRGNLVLRTVDVEHFEEVADEALFATQSDSTLPWLVVHYPQHLGVATPVAARPLNEEVVAGLLHSPVRRELVRRLAAGQTAVWLLLEGDDAQQNQSAAERLHEELKKLQTELVLPELTDSPDDALRVATPLEIEFSILTVPRKAMIERSLVAMLIHSEPDLLERNGPIVFPVFGRGRALFPLVGAGITSENIKNSAAFLVGPCSCQVKEQNPGFDLLLSADWGALLSISDPAPMAAANPGKDDEVVQVPIPSGSAPAPPAVTSQPQEDLHGTNHVWWVGGLVVVSVLAFVVIGLIRR